jgi:4-aminobutyrate aminotransferase-like enzyme
MLRAVEFSTAAIANRVVIRGLARGLIVLQSGTAGTSITLAPPLIIEDAQLRRGIDLFEGALHEAEET